MTPNLAIVIPAYKPDFFKETLLSIKAQTDQRFSLYIFDDASPADLKSIVHEVDFSSNVNYHRFETNIGQQSLVKQWERCIRMTGDEDWVWLFSDDDLMSTDCVESFYQTLQEYPDFSAYRFNTEKISTQGEIIRKNQFPNRFDGADFLNIKLSYQQESYVVEYIFSRQAYRIIGGFPVLPLAWTTDDLFCTKLANHKNICTINGGIVKWRYSDSNISGRQDRTNALQKMQASLRFVDWIFDQDEIVEKLDPVDLPMYWYVRQIRSMESQLTLFDQLNAVRKIAKRDRNVWRYYLRMKKNRSKLLRWLKRFSS